jgi:hypothetical protein
VTYPLPGRKRERALSMGTVTLAETKGAFVLGRKEHDVVTSPRKRQPSSGGSDLKEAEQENKELKRLLREKELEIAILRDLLKREPSGR